MLFAVLLTGPAFAQVYQNNIDDQKLGVYPPRGWELVCVDPACNPGGNVAGPTSTSQTIDNPVPSLDGDSMMFSITAPSQSDGTNALWTYIAGAEDDITISSFDIEVYIGENGDKAGQLEYDQFDFSVSQNTEFMWGSQCNQAAGVWDVFDQQHLAWVATNVPCALSGSTWHRIEETVHRTKGDTGKCSGEPCEYYDTLIIDGVVHNLNLVYGASPLPNGWRSAVGFQIQIDALPNADGATIVEYLDEANYSAVVTLDSPTGLAAKLQ
jgi:hypothetical protein